MALVAVFCTGNNTQWFSLRTIENSWLVLYWVENLGLWLWMVSLNATGLESMNHTWHRKENNKNTGQSILTFPCSHRNSYPQSPTPLNKKTKQWAWKIHTVRDTLKEKYRSVYLEYWYSHVRKETTTPPHPKKKEKRSMKRTVHPWLWMKKHR